MPDEANNLALFMRIRRSEDSTDVEMRQDSRHLMLA